MVKVVKQTGHCAECSEKVDANSDTIQFFESILDSMFTEYETTYTAQDFSDSGSTLTVTVLNGESLVVPYIASMSVLQLKTKIFEKFKIDISQQKLLHNDKELKVSIDFHIVCTRWYYQTSGFHKTSYVQFCTYNEHTWLVDYIVLNLFLSTKLFLRIFVKTSTVLYIGELEVTRCVSIM